MRVVVNGEPRRVDPGATLADVARQVSGGGPRPGVAAARNGEVVPRGEWDETMLAEGDRVEILVATQGG